MTHMLAKCESDPELRCYRWQPGDEPILGYRLVEPLGTGGFGEVWKCTAPGGLVKAIKIIRTSNSSIGNRQYRDVSVRCRSVMESRHPAYADILYFVVMTRGS